MASNQNDDRLGMWAFLTLIACIVIACAGLFAYNVVKDDESRRNCVANGGTVESVNNGRGGWVCVGDD